MCPDVDFYFLFFSLLATLSLPHIFHLGIYQIANLHDLTGNFEMACKYFSILLTAMPTDPGILSRLGQTFVKDDDESQAFHYHSESYRHYPVNLEVISWLGVWYVKSEMYERAIQYFERDVILYFLFQCSIVVC